MCLMYLSTNAALRFALRGLKNPDKCFTQVQECKLSHETCCTVQYDLNNSPYDEQFNTVLKDDQYQPYPEPSLENDQKYVPYGDNNQADVAELNPSLENDAELQSGTNDRYAIDSVAQPHDNVKDSKEVPIDYNHVSDGSSPQEQFQQGTHHLTRATLHKKKHLV